MALRMIRGGGETTPRRGDVTSTRRLFFAFDLPEPIRDEVVRLVESFALPPAEVRPVKGENLHITLKFLGDNPPERIDDLVAAAHRAVAEVSPFSLSIEGIGLFPNHDKPRVLWLGVLGDLGKAQGLEQALSNELLPLGVVPDERSYAPHLTVGRVVTDRVRGRLARLVREKKGVGAGIMPVTGITLYESALHPDGSVYRPLAAIPLGGKK
ncbi:MAG: RNA 2',3'-cyclic phosphodiesterase [Nitrospinae bacterium]|nr:RNA 2',3'-cyclic phosphodiesterase [Nitrospinota bacterium]